MLIEKEVFNSRNYPDFALFRLYISFAKAYTTGKTTGYDSPAFAKRGCGACFTESGSFNADAFCNAYGKG